MSKKENKGEYYVILRGFKYVDADGNEHYVRRAQHGKPANIVLLPPEAVKAAEEVYEKEDAKPCIVKAKKSQIPGG